MPEHQQRFLVNDYSKTSNFYQYGWHRGSYLPSMPNTVHSNGRALAMYLTRKNESRYRWHVIDEPLNPPNRGQPQMSYSNSGYAADQPVADEPAHLVERRRGQMQRGRQSMRGGYYRKLLD